MLVTNYPVTKIVSSTSDSDNVGLCHTQSTSETQETINIETTVSETFIVNTDNTDYFSKYFEQDILEAEREEDEGRKFHEINLCGQSHLTNGALKHG